MPSKSIFFVYQNGVFMLNGKVIRSTGSWYRVKTKAAELYECRIKGKFRLGDQILTNPVAVGDYVTFEIESEADKTGIIIDIGVRHNYVVRQSPRKKHQLHLLASNIDQALLIVTIIEPSLKQGFIDRFLLMTEPHDIPVTIVFNKCDLYGEAELEVYQALCEIYTSIGYNTILLSAETGMGIDVLKSSLGEKTTLVSGQSGVGKSTLLNKLSPNLKLKTAELSSYMGKGQHTTTFAEMYQLSFGGEIIDTPGIKTLSFNNLSISDVAHNFREFFDCSPGCRFANCSHRDEPHCAVKEGLETGQLSQLRYFNYINILEEIEEQNSWERHRKY